LEGQQNQELLQLQYASANTIIYLPYDFSIESDITYNTNSGYSGGFEQEEWLWERFSAETALQTKKRHPAFQEYYDIFTTTQATSAAASRPTIFGTPRPIR